MYAIVGLGNPGKKYEHTRHNIGFLAVDYLAEKHDIKVNKIKHKALVGEGVICGEKVLLVKPQTFMNLSGNAVREIVAYYKIQPEELIVIYDDVDLEMGRLRIRKRGSAGSHNGMKSIIYDIQQDDFPRVRVGIGGERKSGLANYVLGGFGKEERTIMEKAVVRAAEAVVCIIAEDADAAMNKFNVWETDADKNGE
jgi:PTH1 family peptidyl-tRNA hydrolase